MVYPAVPVYLDPPNWQQQEHQIAAESAENPPLIPSTTTTSSGSTIRPPLMLERARVASTQPPEPALKCPRCESINTKFCYYNNYSKTQPRHFCKTCRRYWTRGGALRNVPVGGGCRRNKRNKNNTRSSPVGDRGSGSTAASGSAIAISSAASGSVSAIDVLGLDQHQIPLPQSHLPFMTSFHHLTEFAPADIGLPFAGIHPLRSERMGGSGCDMDFPVGHDSGSIGQWRLQQPNQHFPVTFGRADTMASLEQVQAPGLFPFDSEGVEQQYNQLRAKPPSSSLAQLKLEDNQGQNLPRQFLGLQATNDQYWTGNAWTDLSGFSTSTSSFL